MKDQVPSSILCVHACNARHSVDWLKKMFLDKAGFRNLGARDNCRLPMSITSKVTFYVVSLCEKDVIKR